MQSLSAASALPLILVGFAARADPQGLSTGVPVQIEDALPIRLGGVQLQGAALFTHDTRNRRGSDLWALNPSIKLGPLPGLQIDATPSYSIGDQSGAGSGNGTISALYQLTRNSTYVPALALHGYYATPYGSGHKSAQYTLRAIATKYLGTSEQSPRLHLNLSWYHLTQPSRTQRDDQLEIAVGMSALVAKSTAVVADVVHGARSSKGANQTFVDVGLRHEISDTWAISGGVGAGLGQQSPGFRVFFAVQKDLRLF